MTKFRAHLLNRLGHASLANLSTRALSCLVNAIDSGHSLVDAFALAAQGLLHGAGKTIERELAVFRNTAEYASIARKE